MNDKDFIFDFYIGDDENNAENNPDVADSNEPHLEVESEILLNSFAEEEAQDNTKSKKNIFSRFAIWWKNRKKWQKAAIIAAIAIILVSAIVLSVFLSGLGYNYNKITNNHEELGVENVIDKDIVNVALFGIDTRNTKSFKGNSDSIMVLSLNTKTKKVKIISLMRDSFVPITYNGNTTYSKINSAYAKGGPELAIKVINTNFGLDITEYATVNFFGMVDIIDAVGGIEAELTRAEVAMSGHAINACIVEICNSLNVKAEDYYITTPGKQHLNGIQAVAYSRIRYVANIWGTNNDYGRTDRQRYVMEQLFNKALTIDKSQYIKLVKSLIPCTETSLSYTEIMGLAFDMLLESPSFEQERIPREDMIMRQPKTRAGSVVYYDLGFANKLIHAFIYDDITFEEYIETNGVEKNDWYNNLTKNPSSNNSGNKDNSSISTSKPSNDKNNESKSESSNDKTSSKPTNSSEDKTTNEKPSVSDEENALPDSSDSESDDSSSSKDNSSSSPNNSSGEGSDKDSKDESDSSEKEENDSSSKTEDSDDSKPADESDTKDDSKPSEDSNPSDPSSDANSSPSSNSSTTTSSSDQGAENTSNNVTN